MGFRLYGCLFVAIFGSLVANRHITAKNIQQDRNRRVQGLEVGRQNAQYQDCVDNLYASDVNGDLNISEDEYVLFIARESEGALLFENFSDLPFPLVTNFVYGACFCSIIFQTPNCCVGAEASIDLNPENSPFIEDNLITICISVGQAIGKEVGTPAPITPPPSVSVPTLPPTAPTLSPTMMVTNATTEAPSASPSSAPTNATSEEPSLSPTIALTTLAPSIPTPMPTPEELTCVDFQYGIGNSDGFSADDIFNEQGNTLKTGLIIATRNVTIETLNTTFPRDESGRRVKRNLQRNHWPMKSSTNINAFLAFRPYELFRIHDFASGSSSSSLQVTDLGRFRLFDQHVPENMDALPLPTHYPKTQVRRRAAYLPAGDSAEHGRKLAFYSDDFQPVINSIFDNPFCDNLPELKCAVVDSTVCVMLEEGDDEEMVRAVLLDGIEESILDGSFQAAIPPENQLPGGEDVGDSS